MSAATSGAAPFNELAASVTPQLQELCRRTEITPILDWLNEFADKHRDFAPQLVELVVSNISAQRIPNKRLALFYLLDSFSKNRRIASLYRPLIAAAITAPFLQTYRSSSDDITKTQLYKLVNAWKTQARFDAALLDNIINSITPPDKSRPTLNASDPRKRPLGDGDSGGNKRSKADHIAPSASFTPPLSSGNGGSNEIDSVLNVLEENLRDHPQLLPTLHELRSLVRRPGGSDVAKPKIVELTAALQAAITRQNALANQPQLQPQAQAPLQSYANVPNYYAQQPIPAPVYQPMAPMPMAMSQPQPPMGYQNFQQYPMPNNMPPPIIQQPMQHQHQHQIHQQQYMQPMQQQQPHHVGNHQRRNGHRDGMKPIAAIAPGIPMTFDLSRLRLWDDSVIASLYDAVPFQCKTCGLRLFDSDSMGAHLDWHFAMNRRQAKRSKQAASMSASQQYYATLSEWVDIDDLTLGNAVRVDEEVKENDSDGSDDSDEESALNALNCPADDEYKNCPICSDPFDLFWSDDEEAWMFRGAKRMVIEEEDEHAPPDESDDDRAARLKRLQVQRQYLGQILHRTCYHSLISGSRITIVPTTSSSSDPQTTVEDELEAPKLEDVKDEAAIDESPPPLEATTSI